MRPAIAISGLAGLALTQVVLIGTSVGADDAAPEPPPLGLQCPGELAAGELTYAKDGADLSIDQEAEAEAKAQYGSARTSESSSPEDQAVALLEEVTGAPVDSVEPLPAARTAEALTLVHRDASDAVVSAVEFETHEGEWRPHQIGWCAQ